MKACDPSTHFMWTGRTVPPRSTSLSPQPLHRIDFIWRLNTHLSSVPCRADDAGPRRDGVGRLCADGRTEGKFKREELRPSARHYFLKCRWKQNVFNVYVRDTWDIWMNIWRQRDGESCIVNRCFDTFFNRSTTLHLNIREEWAHPTHGCSGPSLKMEK